MRLSGPLVSTEWLGERLDDPALCIFDTSIELRHKDGGGYLPVSGLEAWREQHIPGAGFLDVIEALSDSNSDVPFMMPPAQEFADTMMAHGVSDASCVVLYNRGTPMWSTRVWWMLRSIGMTNAAVLDGGIDKWTREGRPLNADYEPPRQGTLSVNARPEMWVDKAAMLALLDDDDVVTLNALSPEIYRGEKNQYGRPGHLPGTHNVFYGHLLDPESGEFRSVDELAPLFEAIGAVTAPRVVTYCGGGISATMDCLALHLLGQDNVAVYDGSMSEWVRDPALPLTLGEAP